MGMGVPVKLRSNVFGTNLLTYIGTFNKESGQCPDPRLGSARLRQMSPHST
jgi:hypothetical protein